MPPFHPTRNSHPRVVLFFLFIPLEVSNVPWLLRVASGVFRWPSISSTNKNLSPSASTSANRFSATMLAVRISVCPSENSTSHARLSNNALLLAVPVVGAPSASTALLLTSPRQKPCSSRLMPTSTSNRLSGPSSTGSLSAKSSGLITLLNSSANLSSSFSGDGMFFSSVGGNSTAEVQASHLFWTDGWKSSNSFLHSISLLLQIGHSLDRCHRCWSARLGQDPTAHQLPHLMGNTKPSTWLGSVQSTI